MVGEEKMMSQENMLSNFGMSSNLSAIVASLRLIQEEGGHNFVIFTADAEKNYYIQFSYVRGEPKLHSEAVSNQALARAFALNSTQIARLKTMGWHPPEVLRTEPGRANFYREWEATNDDERLLLIGRDVMRTFVEVYGCLPNQPISVEIKLETW